MARWFSLFWIFIKINLLTTSGPASVGLLYKEAVGKLMTESQFIESVGFSSVLPGSDALQLVMFVGYAAGGFSGAIAALVEPVTLEYPVAKEVHNHWKEILKTDTPTGRNLREELDTVRKAGIEPYFSVRHGSAVHEILDEVRGGSYDLVGMGSPFSTHSLRHLYLPNVTAEVAEVIHCPVLAARQGHELVS